MGKGKDATFSLVVLQPKLLFLVVDSVKEALINSTKATDGVELSSC